MQRHTEHLDIGKILQVAETLENILHGCFGPEGGQVLFIKSIGDLLITKDGRRILECLLLDHPVARSCCVKTICCRETTNQYGEDGIRDHSSLYCGGDRCRMIVNSASRHYSITGDGVKSFVLLLCAVLRELQATADKNEGLLLSGKATVKNQYQRQGYALRRLSNMLLTFQSRVLDHITAEHLSSHSLSVFSNTEGNITLCRASLQQTLDTFFSGRIGCNIQEFISRLACEYLYSTFLRIDDLSGVVRLVSQYFYELLTEVPGLPVDNSRILPGVILHRTFSVYCPAEGEVRALIVREQIHQCLSEKDIGFLISSDVQLEQSQLFLRERTECFLKRLQKKEIKIIFSSVKQHEIVLYYAKLSGISVVDCLPSEELDLLCMIARGTPVSRPFSDVLSSELFLATSCKPIVIGSKKYVHLVLQSSLAFQPHSLVLCGPVKGLTEQLVSSFHGAFKMLTQLFRPFNGGPEQPTNYVDSSLPNRTEEQSVTCNGCQGDCKCHLENKAHAVHVPLTHSDSACASGECSASFSPSSRCGYAGSMCFNEDGRKPHQEPCIIHENTSNIAKFANIGLVFPGAGAFELLLKDDLHNFAKTCQDAELASLCIIIGNSLLCIPRQIYKAKTGQIPFSLYSKHKNMKLLHSLNVVETGLEPVSCKYQLLASVLHCVSQLVTINLIVGVKKTRNTESEETDEDIVMTHR